MVETDIVGTAEIDTVGMAETCESVQRPRSEFETQDLGPVFGVGAGHCHSGGPSLHSAESLGSVWPEDIVILLHLQLQGRLL